MFWFILCQNIGVPLESAYACSILPKSLGNKPISYNNMSISHEVWNVIVYLGASTVAGAGVGAFAGMVGGDAGACVWIISAYSVLSSSARTINAGPGRTTACPPRSNSAYTTFSPASLSFGFSNGCSILSVWNISIG